MTTTVDRAAYISGLRKFADLLAEHDDFPLPYVGSTTPLTIYTTQVADVPALLRKYAAAVGPVTIKSEHSLLQVNGALDGLLVGASVWPSTKFADKVTVTTSVDTVEWTLHADVLAAAVDTPLAVEALAE